MFGLLHTYSVLNDKRKRLTDPEKAQALVVEAINEIIYKNLSMHSDEEILTDNSYYEKTANVGYHLPRNLEWILPHEETQRFDCGNNIYSTFSINFKYNPAIMPASRYHHMFGTMVESDKRYKTEVKMMVITMGRLENDNSEEAAKRLMKCMKEGFATEDHSVDEGVETDFSFINKNIMLYDVMLTKCKNNEIFSLHCYGVLRSEEPWRHPRTGDMHHLHSGIILQLHYPSSLPPRFGVVEMAGRIWESFVLYNFY
ncbi:hypothetical protein QA601_11380 [Chitinispirillales bacterium ANBcel5]|uniref:hypothetical protein n=1 Tax=Cellulosispirillum alkaliphilum TaxID=3039283 RepID=UPI002A542A5B|nr:hypothetical protein [Chitinispirillales bacterium ANBcel5]